MLTKKLWEPSVEQINSTQLKAFSKFASEKLGRSFADYDDLHKWSIEPDASFWDCLWDFADLAGEKGARHIENGNQMPGANYFPDAKLNFAENILRFEGAQEAMVFRCEDKVEKRMSRNQMREKVSLYQQAFLAKGLEAGDRVAAMMPNMPETIIAMLAVTSLGGIWSSCSPDFGAKGVLDRFGQIKPKFFITCDGYWYNGKKFNIAEKLQEITLGLSTPVTLIVPLLGTADETADQLSNAFSEDAFLQGLEPTDVKIKRFDFDHPLFVMFSSGTTGVPKCIVHSHGGALLKLVCEHQLQTGMKEGDRVFYFTTCGWMMWNWLVGALASGVTLLLFDGSPFAPSQKALFDYVEEERGTFFGMSAKFIDAIRISGFKPKEEFSFEAVRMISSTGSPLAPENFEFVYSSIKSDVHLASMSGGTDLMGCFVAGVPWNPVYKGEIQGKALGMAVEVWDDDGNPMPSGKGELMCVKPFPSMPIYFWNDEDGSTYHNAYFDRFENVWCHGDFAEWTETGGMIIHGRSDATLNPGGVRIGTAEIYNQVEQMIEVEEGLCIGQDWQGDVRVVLFVRLADGKELTQELEKEIRDRIRKGASPRHVPAKIIEVADIPRTKSGKITELAVRDIVHGRVVKNREALANPEALDLYENIEALQA